MIKYSVVIPVYRVEAYLPACIDSVLSQKTDAPYEIVLIDDGSPDRSGEICDGYAAKNACVQVRHIENQGVSHARNLGMETARGEYVIFLDADDYWEPDFLQTMDAITERNPDMAAVGFQRVFEDGRKEPMPLPVTPAGESGAAFLSRLFAVNETPLFFTWSYAYRREFALANALQFPEHLKVSEDFVQIMGAIRCAASITGSDRPVYNYRMRGGSATASLTVKKLMDNLTTKADFFRLYSNASMANLYANNALLVTRLAGKDRLPVKEFLRSNRDIWRYVSVPAYKLGRVLVTCFGDCGGAEVFRWIYGFIRFLKGK